MRVRVIPSILTDGVSQVKGSRFDNWRTVGVIRTAVEVHANRDVDELLLLDVSATQEHRTIDWQLVQDVSEVLRIPLSVGGGIDSVRSMAKALEAGADKVVIGSAFYDKPQLVGSLAREFGSQAIVTAIDIRDDGTVGTLSVSGSRFHKIDPVSLARRLEDSGAGELLVQNVQRDGTMVGMDVQNLRRVADAVSIPVIGSSGAGAPEDMLLAVKSGCSAVAAGALFQFTETTPRMVKNVLSANAVEVRK